MCLAAPGLHLASVRGSNRRVDVDVVCVSVWYGFPCPRSNEHLRELGGWNAPRISMSPQAQCSGYAYKVLQQQRVDAVHVDVELTFARNRSA